MKQLDMFTRPTPVPPICSPGTCEICDEAVCGDRHASGLRCTNTRDHLDSCDPTTPHMARRPDDGRLVAWCTGTIQWHPLPQPANPWHGSPWSTWTPGQYDAQEGK